MTMRTVQNYLHTKNQTAVSFFKEAHRWKYGSEDGYYVHLLRYEICGSIAYFIGEYLVYLKEKGNETICKAVCTMPEPYVPKLTNGV